MPLLKAGKVKVVAGTAIASTTAVGVSAGIMLILNGGTLVLNGEFFKMVTTATGAVANAGSDTIVLLIGKVGGAVTRAMDGKDGTASDKAIPPTSVVKAAAEAREVTVGESKLTGIDGAGALSVTARPLGAVDVKLRT